ncbi:hypothetical protein D3C72_1447510 [compost metagenome]
MVGAVTTLPPAAFSSLTAIAYRLTRCTASCGKSLARLSDAFASCAKRHNFAARRFTFKPPGRLPVVSRPCAMQSRMTCQMRSRPAFNSSSLRLTHSFARSISGIDKPLSTPWASNCSMVSKGKTTRALAADSTAASAWAAV